MTRDERAMPDEDRLERLDLIAARTGDLPPLPATAIRAMQMSRDRLATAHDLQMIISQDQALSAKILRIVNSAAYSLRSEVSTISHAVALLGMEAVRSIIMGASVQQFNETGMRRAGNLATKLMADHSWGAAVAARIVARYVRYGNLEEAFLSGLIHDLGKPALLQCLPDEYLAIVNDAYRGMVPFYESEMSSLGFSHAHVGSLLAEKWHFPPQLVEAIRYHHTPLSAPEHTKLACVTALSNRIMVFLEVGFERDSTLKLEALPEVAFLKLSRPMLDSVALEVQASLKQMAESVVR